MDRREFTKSHLIMIIAALIGVGTIIWAIWAIRDAKIKEAQALLDKTPKVEEVVEVVEPEVVLPDDFVEPDLTLAQFEAQKLKVELSNDNRYDIEELDSIINKLVNCKDENGERLELHLATDNSLEVALITEEMYNECLSVWLPKNDCIILIFDIGNQSPGGVTNNIREYFDFLYRSSSNNTTRNTFKYFETFSYNGRTVFTACDNAMDLANEIQKYMINKDQQAVADFASKYEVNEYGAYLKEEAVEETPKAPLVGEHDTEILGTEETEIETEIIEEAEIVIEETEISSETTEISSETTEIVIEETETTEEVENKEVTE